jgi:hypothetical protein
MILHIWERTNVWNKFNLRKKKFKMTQLNFVERLIEFMKGLIARKINF